MKKIIYFFATILLFTISCNDKKSPEKVENSIVNDGEKFNIDIDKSRIEWKGYKIFKDENLAHIGTLKFSKVEIFLKDGKISGGNFIADIHSLEDVDITDASEKTKLENHLKSADFFDAEKFPTAKFELTKISVWATKRNR